MMQHVMLDLETLDSGSNSLILSIGAVKFDPETGQLGDQLYIVVEPKSCIEYGLTMSVDTVMFWMRQDEAARVQFQRAGMTLVKALAEFAKFLTDEKGTAYRIWGNGATFDNVIMSNAYKAVGAQQPWAYKHDRCYRTIRAMYPQIEADPRKGVYHNALDDAVHQAKHLLKIWPFMKANEVNC